MSVSKVKKKRYLKTFFPDLAGKGSATNNSTTGGIPHIDTTPQDTLPRRSQ